MGREDAKLLARNKPIATIVSNSRRVCVVMTWLQFIMKRNILSFMHLSSYIIAPTLLSLSRLTALSPLSICLTSIHFGYILRINDSLIFTL